MKQGWKEKIRAFSDERWAIGLIETPLEEILRGAEPTVRWIADPHRRRRWFADPFVLDADDATVTLLAEEMYKPRGVKLGRISRVVVDRRTMTITEVTPLLELPTHLSFPAYYRADGEVFVYPENSEAGNLTLYHYTPDALTPVATLCDEPVADAIITHAFGEPVLFATRRPNVNGNRLCIYRREGERFVMSEEITFGENTARMAGNFFSIGGKVYRPAQECNEQYGHAVVLQEVTHDGGEWQFGELRRLYSTHPTLTVGSHTFNYHPQSGLIATDALGWDRRWFRRLLATLHLH